MHVVLLTCSFAACACPKVLVFQDIFSVEYLKLLVLSCALLLSDVILGTFFPIAFHLLIATDISKARYLHYVQMLCTC